MKRCLVSCSLTVLCFISLNGFAQNAKQLKTLNDYKKCLLNADKELINQFTSKDFRMGVYQAPTATNSFGDFLKNAPKPDSIFWEKVKTVKGKCICKVHYLSKSKEVVSNVVFSNDGKLLYSDWLDQRGFNFNRYEQSRKIATIPFEVYRGSIIIKAKLNDSDKELKFLLDTGADGDALTEEAQKLIDVKITDVRTIVVPGGQTKVNYSAGNVYHFGDFKLDNQNLVVFPKFRPGIDGLLGGSTFFREYITEVNFDKKEIVLYSFGENEFFKEYQSTKLNYHSGIPSIPLQFQSKGNRFDSEFILDTGADYQAIMFGFGTKKQNEDLLISSLTPLYDSFNYSVGTKSAVKVGLAKSISFAGLQFDDASLVVESYSKDKHNAHTVDGSIGIELLKRFNWVVDLGSYTLFTKENADYNMPLDFAVNNYLFGFFNNNLFVKRNLGTEDGKSASPDDPIKPGELIISIDGIAAKDLTKDNVSKIQKKSTIDLVVQRKGQIVEVKL